jgi:hypothetical protein
MYRAVRSDGNPEGQALERVATTPSVEGAA